MVLGGLAVYIVASLGCALAGDVAQLILFRSLQGLSTGACIVIARAIPRDMYPPASAQQVMSQVTIFFGVATGFAPLLGGLLFVGLGWRSIFWFLAGFGAVMGCIVWRLLPETLPRAQRQSFRPANLLRGYWTLGRDSRVLLLALAAGVPINGTFIYILSAPVFLGQHLGMQPTQYFWFFLCTISGVMTGAYFSGRLAGRVSPRHQVWLGFRVMLAASAANLLGNLVWPAAVPWAFVPPSVYCCGWAIMQPALTLLLLDLHPERRGMASSLQIFIGSMANSFAAGVVAPLAMGSTRGLAIASAGFLCVSLLAWALVRRLWPELGQSPAGELPLDELQDGV
jgi:MFS transporter, DHA1 family, multidrug resistance protein